MADPTLDASAVSMVDGAIPDAPFVLGGNVFGWTADETQSRAVLDAYVDGGGRMIDTADMYSQWVPGNHGGDSEEIIGRWLAERGLRDEVHLATKVGQATDAPGLTRASIVRGVEMSLRRLQTDHLDLYYAHADDTNTPLEETLEAFDALVRDGKVLHLGVSNFAPERVRRALEISADNGWARFEVVQAHYNLVRREPYESRLRSVVAEFGLTTLPYYSLAQGFLTGKYRDHTSPVEGSRARAKPAQRYLDDRGRSVLSALDRLAASYGVPVAAIALAWLRAQPTVAAPLASARTVAQLAELMATARVTLESQELAALDLASA